MTGRLRRRPARRSEVGTHHLLMELITEGLAAATLERLHVRVDAVRAAITAQFSEPAAASSEVPPMSVEARGALQAAQRTVCRTGTVLRTQHLLYVLITDPGSRARRILNELGVNAGEVSANSD
ncbi:Clp protease N-terminal domain-containing protein [Pseudonocardia sp. TRM90224]|uniref:Clp protease N-terminal domain-containing protein n=1 Tax=Pseudonocardia sp. TRM90224 TaxID=2812678 RepID=UPI0021026C78|nr:Clp protease N-terminal domain-containing protein [Pseudonocardia sp. TRM90224]